MEIRINVIVNGQLVTLQDALDKKYIKLDDNAIMACDEVILKLSTNVFDKQGQEIFFEDILQDDYNEPYVIKNYKGTAYLFKLIDGKCSLFSTLTSVQFENKIDLTKTGCL